jgi:TrmH family RNA methyltransferase
MDALRISSRQNPRFKAMLALKAGRLSQPEGILVEGEKLIAEAIAAGLTLKELWSCRPVEDTPVESYLVSEEMYRQISPTIHGQAPLGVFWPLPEPRSFSDGPLLVMDGIQDPGNAGAMVRAARAFAVKQFAWLKPCVSPYHHAVIRGSAGSVFRATHRQFESFSEWLPDRPLIVACRGGQPLPAFAWPKQFALCMGNEGHGHRQELLEKASLRVGIPQAEDVESLNVAGALHILLYDHLLKAAWTSI